MVNKIEIDPLLYIDPKNYSTGISYIRALVSEDPTICLERWRKIVKYHGIYEKRGFSRTRYHKAVQEWRSENGYHPMGAGSRGAYRPANWVAQSEDASEKAPESPENGLGGAASAPATPEVVEVVSTASGAALAELVWEWMDSNGYDAVSFFDDGEVNVSRRETKVREFSLVEDRDQSGGE